MNGSCFFFLSDGGRRWVRHLIPFAFFVTASLPFTARAQSAEWTVHTSLRETIAVDASATEVWVGTTGGLYARDRSTGEVRRFTIIDGLHGLNIGAVAYDDDCLEAGCVWVGYDDGVLDRVAIGSGAIDHYRDIERTTRFASRAINRLAPHGDSLLVATAFGVVVFDKTRGEVRDSYDQIGGLVSGTAILDVIITPDESGGRVWLATPSGVAWASLNEGNLKDPRVWTVESAGLPSADVRSLASFQGRLYVGTAAGAAVRNADGGYTPLSATGLTVYSLESTSGALVGVTPFGVLVVDPSGTAIWQRVVGADHLASIAAAADGSIWLGDRELGLLSGTVSTDPPLSVSVDISCTNSAGGCYPSGAFLSTASSIEADEAGNLWTVGQTEQAQAFQRLGADGIWTAFTPSGTDGLANRSEFSSIFHAADGTTWITTDGAGLVHVKPNDEIEVYDQTNSSLRKAEATTNEAFVITGGAATDPNGRLWVTNVDATRPLSTRSPDGEWASLAYPEGCGTFSPFNGTFRKIFIDSFGQIWLTVDYRQNLKEKRGVIVLDVAGTPTDQSDDRCRYFSTEGVNGVGLAGIEVRDVVEDKDGFIWVATDKGLSYLLNTGIVARDPGAAFSWPTHANRDDGRYVLYGVRVNDLAVDPANRIWAATNIGAYLIGRDGGEFAIEEQFSASNSPLPSDEVYAVAVEALSGEVYFATASGLVSYGGNAVAAVAELDELSIFPNPAKWGEGTFTAVTIDGLTEATEILITTVEGVVVRRFASRGGRARWDGRDQSGRETPSGMYLVVAVGEDGGSRAFGKLAIIR